MSKKKAETKAKTKRRSEWGGGQQETNTTTNDCEKQEIIIKIPFIVYLIERENVINRICKQMCTKWKCINNI